MARADKVCIQGVAQSPRASQTDHSSTARQIRVAREAAASGAAKQQSVAVPNARIRPRGPVYVN